MREDERKLWDRYQAGDQNALEDLLVYHIGLVRFWANYTASFASWTDRDDLMQEGSVVLIKVIKKFDPNRGIEFSTYAGTWLRKSLLAHLQEARSLTDYLYRQCKKVNEVQDTLMHKLERKPSVAEIAASAVLTEEQVEKALNAIAITQAEGLAIDESDLPASSTTVESLDSVILIDELLLKLNERQRWVLTEYYYLGHTDSEIAKRMGLTSDHVKQIRNRTLKKLTKLLDGNKEIQVP